MKESTVLRKSEQIYIPLAKNLPDSRDDFHLTSSNNVCKIYYECEASGLGGVPSSDFRPSDGQIQNEEKEGRRRKEGTEDETQWTDQATAAVSRSG